MHDGGKKEGKSRNGIFKNSGSDFDILITPTVSALPNNKKRREIINPKNDEKVNFIIKKCLSYQLRFLIWSNKYLRSQYLLLRSIRFPSYSKVQGF